MLGYIISSEGIKANLDKTRAIMIMAEPKNKKELQKLTGRITALNKFISKSAEHSLPFFQALRGGNNFEWGSNQSEAFHNLKEYLANSLVVSVLESDSHLLLYVVASDHAVSAVLVHELEKESGKTQNQFISSQKHWPEPS